MNIQVKPSDAVTTRHLIHQVNIRLQELEPDGVYSLESLLGPDYWADEDHSHLALGRCFSKLVSDSRAPFTSAGLTNNRHNNYRYIK